MKFDDFSWSVAEGNSDGWPFIIRFRQFPAAFPRSAYPHRLNIFWSLSTPMESGLPSKTDSEMLRIFEDHILTAVELDKLSVLSTVLTGKNQREFVFHTRDPQEFLHRLSEMPQGSEPYPLDIYHSDDGDWDYVNQVIGDIGQ